jgi:drug/metabolite transporter (DMT)-like permease
MKVLLVWLATCLIWSAVWLFIKLGLQDLPPLSFAGIRLAIALVALTPLLAVQRPPLPRMGRDVALIAGTGLLLLCLNYALLYWGAQYISSGLTAVLQAVTPAFGLVFAHYLSGESVTLRKAGALGLGIVGVAVIFLNQLQLAGWLALLGCAAVVAAAVCVALAYVLVKAYGRRLHPLTLMAGQMLCGLVPLLTAGLIKEGSPLAFRWTFLAVAALLYLALGCSVLAFWLNYWLLRRLDATNVLLMSIIEPLLAVLLGALVLGESLTARALLGGACVLLSVGLLLTHPGTDRKATSSTATPPIEYS